MNLFFLVQNSSHVMQGMTFTTFIQHFVNALSLGSLYALIAIGYTMVYGILRLINFAHGDLIMISSYVAFYGVALISLPWYLAFLLSIGATVLLGISIERVAYRPLRSAPRVTVFISAIGVSYFLQNLGIVVFGGRNKAFMVPSFFNKINTIAGVNIVTLTFIIPLITIILLMLLLYIINKTKVGMAMRAVAKDYDTSSLMGIDVNRIITTTFGIGSALAAMGGLMWAMKFPQIFPFMGMMPGLKCFIAAVVGGIGNIAGAVVGGFLLGMAEIMLVAFMPTLSGYRDAFAFVILIIILLFKPKGIVGEKVAEKV